jgi:hypothetical protein
MVDKLQIYEAGSTEQAAVVGRTAGCHHRIIAPVFTKHSPRLDKPPPPSI